MKSVKRIITLLLLFSLSPSMVLAEQRTTQKTFLVAYAQDTMANDWRAAQVKKLQEEFARYPFIRFVYTDARGQTAKQIQDIDDFIYQKVDVLITSPRDAVLSTPVISKAYKSGIPVVLITRGIRSENYTTLVAPNDYKIGRKAARYMAEQMNNKGSILVLRGIPTASTAIARTEGFIKEIKKYPGIKIVAIKDGNYLRADAIKAIDAALTAGLKFDAIYAQSDSMASGARMALARAGIDVKSKMIVGIDYISEAREAIRNGQQKASFLYPTSAKQAADIVVKILEGQKVPKHVEVDTALITRNNVEKIKPIF